MDDKKKPVDLFFDESAIEEDLSVRCRISDGPRRDDASFDPVRGDLVRIDDAEQHPIPAVVLSRSGDEVVVRICTVPLEVEKVFGALLRLGKFERWLRTWHQANWN